MRNATAHARDRLAALPGGIAVRGSALERRTPESETDGARWVRSELAGRLVELSAHQRSAQLTLAVTLVLDAQREAETVAWVTRAGTSFYPPDVAAWGVDLEALVVVRVPTGRDVGRAADRLARSGAFGLIVLDLGKDADLPMPLQTRLLGLARTHDCALLCLTAKMPDRPSLSSLISLRAEAVRRSDGGDHHTAELRVLKDKRRAPGWRHGEPCGGPPGLR